MESALLKTKKILALFIFADIVVLAICAFIFWDIKKTNENISSLEQTIQSNTEKEKALSSIEKMLETTKPYVEKLDTFFIGKDSAVGLIETLESLGRNLGVIVSVEKIAVNEGVNSKKANNDFKEMLSLKISFSGGWKEVVKFLGLLENLPYKINIENVAVSNNANASPEKKEKINSLVWSGTADISTLKLR